MRNYLLGFLLLLVIAYGSYSLGRQGYSLEIKNNLPRFLILNQKPADQTVDFSEFWNVYALLNQKYIDRPLDAQKLMYGAAQGLYQSVGDPYTVFLPPQENSEVNSSLNGQYQGIGAELGMKDGQLTVVAPLDDSPAKAAGILPGDLILKIDGKDTLGMTLSEAVSKIRGPAGSRVTLTIRHAASSTSATSSAAPKQNGVDITIVRAELKVPSLKWENKGGGIAYIRISSFGDTTDAEWDKAVAEIKSTIPNLKGVVLDLRSNPGGYFQAAIHVASEFIASGTVSSQGFANGVKQDYAVDHVGLFLNVPGVVLINGGSASASEIVTGALRDRRGFKVVGEKSFGKGTVQDAENLPDGSGVHITIARWLTPNGYNINGSGIKPDYAVDLTADEINKNLDPQLDKALLVIKNL